MNKKKNVLQMLKTKINNDIILMNKIRKDLSGKICGALYVICRDTSIENWMYVFDYIKLGSYHEELGSLDSKTTNQRLYRKNDENKYEDITNRFWIE